MRLLCDGTYRQDDRAPRPTSSRKSDGAIHCGGFACDDHLTRRVEIHRLDHATLRGLVTDGHHVGIVQAQHCSHGSCARRHRFFHRLAPKSHQRDRHRELEHPRCDQCRELAEAVPGNDGWVLPAPRGPEPCRGEARRQHRGLGVFGGVQPFLRAFLHEVPQVVAEHGRGFIERIADDRVGAREAGEHADRLGSLTREHKCE
jgi:hypothetical protein